MTTKLTDKNISNVANLGIQWQAVITADGSTATTAVAGRGYLIDTTSNAHTINLPASAIAGDTIAIKDYAGTFGTNALTISRNGSNIQGVANDSQISTNRASVELIYVDSTKGWVYTNESNVADLQFKTYITATGGTVTESGDFKIHSFTGDGCFVVSSLGNQCGSASTVDYLVVAGGGGGGVQIAGAGGAGGFRESKDSTLSSPHTASPLAATSGLTITATTYPVTVGGGGAGAPACSVSCAVTNFGTDGSNSVFSTITSTGGGGGAGNTNENGKTGGSGGGGGLRCGVGGSGNTPPVSPPQGNPGGAALNNTGGAGGGGGGATAAGTNASGCSPAQAGPGGAGATTSISGTSTSYAGGGGGGGRNSPGTSESDAGTGGSGGGGNGVKVGGVAGGAGTSNTGGGGGGSGFSPAVPGGAGGAGGKGIVIIRYKFQN